MKSGETNLMKKSICSGVELFITYIRLKLIFFYFFYLLILTQNALTVSQAFCLWTAFTHQCEPGPQTFQSANRQTQPPSAVKVILWLISPCLPHSSVKSTNFYTTFSVALVGAHCVSAFGAKLVEYKFYEFWRADAVVLDSLWVKSD